MATDAIATGRPATHKADLQSRRLVGDEGGTRRTGQQLHERAFRAFALLP